MSRILPQPAYLLDTHPPVRNPWAMALLLILVVATSACGFKLRGQLQIPPELNPLYIQADQGSALRRSIVDQLQGSKVRLAARPQDARVILRIQKVSRSSRVIAVDRNAKALASELYYRVTFDAVTPGDKQLAPRQTIDITRTYENPDVEVLGKQSEESLIYEEMTSDAADRILDRLHAALH